MNCTFSRSVSPQLHEHFFPAPFCFSTWTALKCNGHWDCNLYAVLLGKQAQRLRTQAAPSLYSLTPRSRVLLEKPTGSHLVKKFPAFYGTRRFFAAFASAHHLSQSWASSIQSITPHPTLNQCTLLQKQREILRNNVLKSGKWQTVSKEELITKHLKSFLLFTKSIDFDQL